MNRRGSLSRWAMVICGLVLIATGFPSPLRAQQLYWVDDGSGFEHIRRANLDGSGNEVVVPGAAHPFGLAVDRVNGKIYWTDPAAGEIHWANLNGSGRDTLITGLPRPRCIALDVAGGKLYWSNSAGEISGVGEIRRANLNGSGMETLISGLSAPYGLELDVAGGKLYWTDNRLGHIRRANLNGSGMETLISGLASPYGLELDVAGGKLYWTDNGLGTIQRANLENGSGMETLMVGLGDPAGLALDRANGKLYWTDPGSGFAHIRWYSLDDSSVGTFITGLGNPNDIVFVSEPSPPPPPSEIRLALDHVPGARGGTATVSVWLTNLTAIPVNALQFQVMPGDPDHIHFDHVINTVGDIGLEIDAETIDGVTTVVIHPDLDPLTDALIPPGERLVCQLVYRVDETLSDGTVIPLHLEQIVMSDAFGNDLPTIGQDGSITVGERRGDLTHDGNINVRDLVLLIRMLLGKDPYPAPGTGNFFVADGNRDGAINVADAVYIINVILGRVAKPIVDGPTSPVTVSLDEIQTLESGQVAVPVIVQSDGVLAGLQATFTFDPALVQIETPQLAERAFGMTLMSHVQDGTLRLVLYSVSGQGIAAGSGPVLLIPVTVVGGAEVPPTLTLSQIVLANQQAHAVPVVLGTSTVKVTALPTAFALNPNRPNPFNPTTQIAYDVPQTAHITLTVYNLLGQEVVCLVDAVNTPGRYVVTWAGRTAHGSGVASGVYLYRLTSSTGFSQTRRMTMVK